MRIYAYGMSSDRRQRSFVAARPENVYYTMNRRADFPSSESNAQINEYYAIPNSVLASLDFLQKTPLTMSEWILDLSYDHIHTSSFSHSTWVIL